MWIKTRVAHNSSTAFPQADGRAPQAAGAQVSQGARGPALSAPRVLLDLIRKQEIDIYDIPIAQITGQYLEYIQQHLEQLDTELAGEFILMAATLIHIKSKMLLPPDPVED